MKAIVQDSYGGPEALELAEIDRPPLGDRDTLVRVRAASIHFGDQMMMRASRSCFARSTGWAGRGTAFPASTSRGRWRPSARA